MGQEKSVPVKLNIGEKDEMEVESFRVNKTKFYLALAAIVLTGGLIFMILSWRKQWKLGFLYERCELHQADKLLIKDTFGQLFEENIHMNSDTEKSLPFEKYFYNKNIKYVWDGGIMHFIKLRPYDLEQDCNQFYERRQGLDPSSVSQMLAMYGINSIDVIVSPVWKLVWHEVSNPFYLLQTYTTILWAIQGFYFLSIVIIGMTTVAVSASVWETRRQTRVLREKMRTNGQVTVRRNGQELTLDSTEVIPGDRVLIQAQGPQTIHFDCVLIQGTCSVDESMLTGECVPITKVPLPCDSEINFDYELHKRHILFSGTQFIQGRGTHGESEYLYVVVIRTGFVSLKGELVRSILFPKPVDFHLYQDFMKCVVAFFVIGLGAMCYSAYVWIMNGGTIAEIILNSIDLVTFVVPPILPAALTTINAVAQKRLKKEGIFCLNSNYINLCGGVDVMCFDKNSNKFIITKTGTLTEGDLDLEGVLPIADQSFQSIVNDVRILPNDSHLLECLATCHSLITVDGKLSGFTVDQKMFEATHWILKEGPLGENVDYGKETTLLVCPPAGQPQSDTEIAILKQFPFESALQRMSVLIQRRGESGHEMYMKGSPEMLSSLADPLTIPENFKQMLDYYTRQGYRVLALGRRDLRSLAWSQLNTLHREDIEVDVELLGFLLTQNQLKPETTPTLHELHQANIRTVMITGDNLQTALTMARACDMLKADENVIEIRAQVVEASLQAAQHLNVHYVDPIEEIAFLNRKTRGLQNLHRGHYSFIMDGKTFELLRLYDEALLETAAHRGKVFARMLPEQKVQLIEILQNQGHQVGMVGDGFNDSAALKTAHAGVSLSAAEASVAAPFTSQSKKHDKVVQFPNIWHLIEADISCVPSLIRHGRCAITSAFSTFFFSVAASFVLLAGVMLLFSISAEPSDFQYYFFDLCFFLVPFFSIGNALPFPYLHPQRPPRHLWAFLPLFSFATFLLWQILVLVVGWFYCLQQPWFEPYVFEAGKFPPNPSYEETTVYLLLMVATCASAFVFSPSSPYAQPFYKNWVFMAWAVEAAIATCIIFFLDTPGFIDLLNFKAFPYKEYPGVLLGLGLAGIVFCFIWEQYFLKGWVYHVVMPMVKQWRGPRYPYEKLEAQLLKKKNWPTVGYEERIVYDENLFHGGSVKQKNGTTLEKQVSFEVAQETPRTSTSPTLSRTGVGKKSFKDALSNWHARSFKTFRGGATKGQYNIETAGTQLEEAIPLQVTRRNALTDDSDFPPSPTTPSDVDLPLPSPPTPEATIEPLSSLLADIIAETSHETEPDPDAVQLLSYNIIRRDSDVDYHNIHQNGSVS